jgi:hypothetical protein
MGFNFNLRTFFPKNQTLNALIMLQYPTYMCIIDIYGRHVGSFVIYPWGVYTEYP